MNGFRCKDIINAFHYYDGRGRKRNDKETQWRIWYFVAKYSTLVNYLPSESEKGEEILIMFESLLSRNALGSIQLI